MANYRCRTNSMKGIKILVKFKKKNNLDENLNESSFQEMWMKKKRTHSLLNESNVCNHM